MPARVDALTFPARRITFPIVLDDQWCREALARYMRSVRNRAAYLPSNVEYLARNNGLAGAEDALRCERERREAAERAVAEMRRECREPFVVPALVDAFVGLSRVTGRLMVDAGSRGEA